jgi:hypothetical protein
MIPPRVFEAELVPGPSGAVQYGNELTPDEASERRRKGLDLVVCGGDSRTNRQLARRIESAVGPPTKAQPPEPKAGPLALPHFHQQSRKPGGHSFYETDKRKARKRK